MLSAKEKKQIKKEIKDAKLKLKIDKLVQPKRKLTEKQLIALEEGRKKNTRFKPKENKQNENTQQQEQRSNNYNLEDSAAGISRKLKAASYKKANGATDYIFY